MSTPCMRISMLGTFCSHATVQRIPDIFIVLHPSASPHLLSPATDTTHGRPVPLRMAGRAFKTSVAPKLLDGAAIAQGASPVDVEAFAVAEWEHAQPGVVPRAPATAC